MSAEEVTKPEKPRMFENWRNYPIEVKIMDFSILAWLAIIILEVIFYLVNVPITIRNLSAVMLPIIMFVVTFSLRLRLVEKPSQIKNIFYTWIGVFVFLVILSLLLLILYPPLVPEL